MQVVVPGNSRGASHFGWLKSRHTYSFGDYFNTARSGFSVLKVINEDEVAPGKGFETHSHRNMEIISYVLKGALEHRDSLGNASISHVGDIQLLSAGHGVFHSEFNASKTDELVFLQIWIEPFGYATTPRFQCKSFDVYEKHSVLITPDGRDGSLAINQDVTVSVVTLQQDDFMVRTDPSRTYYVHTVFGSVQVSESALKTGDGIEIQQASEIVIQPLSPMVHAIIFDMPGITSTLNMLHNASTR